MAETPIRQHASENDVEKMLRLCAEDPMWAAHSEVSKSLLVRAADELAALRKDAERYRKLRRGQHWSVVNGAGDELRAERLDAAVDAAPAVGAA